MKKTIVLTLFLVLGFTMFVPDTYGQTSRKRMRGWKTNAAIVGGSALAGALIGRGRNGAMIGAGAGLLYASSRKGTKRNYANSKYRRAAKVGGGALLGAGTGAWVGGKTGMIVGGLAGAGATYLYTRSGRKYYRSQNGRTYYVKNGRRYYL